MAGFLNSIGYSSWILHVLLVLPVVGAVATVLSGEGGAKRTALLFSMVEFVLSIGLWWAVDTSSGTLQMVYRTPWLARWGISYAVGIDGITLFMVLLSTALTVLSVLGSFNYIEKQLRGFYALLLLLLTGMLGVFLSLDLFLFYVMWEVMLVPMYFIIGIWGGGRRLYAAIKFFIFTFVGSMLMLVAILAMVYAVARESGQLNFGYEHLLQHREVFAPMAPWLFTAFALAFAIKVPIFPLHTWLPDAHVEAPTAGSVILAGVLLKMGTYGFIRFAVPFFPVVALSPLVTKIIVALAVIGIVYGALVAMVQPDIKKLVAYSSVSHLGFVMLGIWAGTVQSLQGALMVMIGHGISTGALFFIVGMLYERRHTREIADFGGLAKVVPALAAVFTVVALSSIGLPGLNGFVGEFLVLLGSYGTFPVPTIIATTGVIFAAAYLLWALQRIIYQRLDRPENEKLPDLSPREWAVLIPLLVGIVWMGLYPRPVLERMEPAAKRYIELSAPGRIAAQPDKSDQSVGLGGGR